ncbi:MAG: GntR family transcriptional regulator [Janthinobacterium lividum]
MSEQVADHPVNSLQGFSFEPRPVLVRDQTLERLREAIINGQIAPGTRLIERELCEAMSVSRTSIREVLRRLESEKLILVEGRQGPVVASVSKSQALEIYDLRTHLESLQIKRFVEFATDKEIKALNNIFTRFEKATKSKDVPLSVKLMTEFYDHINTVARSEIVRDILSQLNARVSYLRATSMSTPGRMRNSVEEIGMIVEAVSRHDTAAAQEAVIKHVQNAAITAVARLSD